MFWANFRCDEHNLWVLFCVYLFFSSLAPRSSVPFVRKFLEFCSLWAWKGTSHKSHWIDEKGNLIAVEFVMIWLGVLKNCFRTKKNRNSTLHNVIKFSACIKSKKKAPRIPSSEHIFGSCHFRMPFVTANCVGKNIFLECTYLSYQQANEARKWKNIANVMNSECHKRLNGFIWLLHSKFVRFEFN